MWRSTRTIPRRVIALVLAATIVAACTGDDGGEEARSDEEPVAETEAAGYEATIRRTSFGIPHITAEDRASLAFGQGYAMAEDHLCDVADQVIKVRGERSRWFGRGEEDANVDSDFGMLAVGVYAQAEEAIDELPDDARTVIEGTAAGYNAFLEEVGPDGVGGWCRGEEWVTPVTPVDLLAVYKDLALLASARPLVGFIAKAQPPEGAADASTTTTEAAFAGALNDLRPSVASNGWAIGRDMAEEGNGLLYANPHFPWEGELRLWEVHLTIPGELDVYGATLHGVPGVLIGFNEAVGWTHTVSAGHRFTAYRLELVPGDPTSYLYDGERRQMESREHTIEVLGDDGEVVEETRTLWRTHYGPVLDFPGLGWTAETTLAYRDANIENDRLISQFMGMNEAESLQEFQDVHEEVNGIPWVNTMAVDAEGNAWYTDSAATPNLSDEAIERWLATLEDDPIAQIAYDNGAVLLDGSDSTFEWVEAEGARSPGLVPPADQPKLERTDYVFNANDSYWIANPEELLTGFSPLHGREETAPSLRTRMNVVALEEQREDGFTLEELQEVALSNRSLLGELVRDDVVSAVCTPEAADLAAACDALRRWDLRFDLSSVGAPLFRLFAEQYLRPDLRAAGALFSEDFDPADPISTPSGSSLGDPANRDRAAQALRDAQSVLQEAGFAVDAPYGELQYTERAGERIPMHGSDGGRTGALNVITFGRNKTTLEPEMEHAETIGESSLTAEGWPVNFGTSFLMTLVFTDDGPRAQALLTYGESADPESPHFRDQTKRFADKAWRDVLFTDEQIENDPELREYTVRGDR